MKTVISIRFKTHMIEVTKNRVRTAILNLINPVVIRAISELEAPNRTFSPWLSLLASQKVGKNMIPALYSAIRALFR